MIEIKRVEELVKWINSKKDMDYEVLETFQKSGTNTYKLHNLKAQIEQDVLLICDDEGKVYSERCGIMCSLVSSIKDIGLNDDSVIMYLESEDIGQAVILIKLV